MHIHEEDCDVEMLEESDFRREHHNPVGPLSGTTRLHELYMIEMSKLSTIRECNLQISYWIVLHTKGRSWPYQQTTTS